MVESGTGAGHSAGETVNAAEGIAVDKPVKITIASDYAAAREVQERILEEVVNSGFDSQSHFAIRISLEEAFINAMKHGNKNDPKKKVQIEYKVDSELVEVTVEDEGPGFERQGVPDPTLDENIEKCSGRGILLMEAYMSSVHWSRGGRRVHMIFRKNQMAPGS